MAGSHAAEQGVRCGTTTALSALEAGGFVTQWYHTPNRNKNHNTKGCAQDNSFLREGAA